MKAIFDKIIATPLKNFFQQFIAFLPNLFSSLIILVLGLLLAWIIKLVIAKILKLLHLDRFLAKTGMMETLAKIGVKDTPAKLVGRMFYWIIVIIFIIIALYALKVPSVDQLLEKFLLFLPNIFIALILIVSGYLLGNFLGRAALIASVNAGITFSSLISKGVKTAVLFVAFIMALDQIGIGQRTLVVAFTILLAGLVLALSLAFGLGGKDIAKDYLEKKLKKRPKEKDEFKHL